jgi:hypothetical protein
MTSSFTLAAHEIAHLKILTNNLHLYRGKGIFLVEMASQFYFRFISLEHLLK